MQEVEHRITENSIAGEGSVRNNELQDGTDTLDQEAREGASTTENAIPREQLNDQLTLAHRDEKE